MSRLRYRNPNSPRVLGVRVLKPEDLEFLRQKSCVPTIKKLRESHHRIAMLIALGYKYTEVALRVGYTPTRVSTLAATPSVKDLIARYREDVNANEIEASREIRDALDGLLRQNLRKMQDRYDEDDEAAEEGHAPGEGKRIRDRDLLTDRADLLDRTGHGKTSTTVNVNVGFAAKLEAARQRATTISAKATSIPTPKVA